MHEIIKAILLMTLMGGILGACVIVDSTVLGASISMAIAIIAGVLARAAGVFDDN